MIDRSLRMATKTMMFWQTRSGKLWLIGDTRSGQGHIDAGAAYYTIVAACDHVIIPLRGCVDGHQLS